MYRKIILYTPITIYNFKPPRFITMNSLTVKMNELCVAVAAVNKLAVELNATVAAVAAAPTAASDGWKLLYGPAREEKETVAAPVVAAATPVAVVAAPVTVAPVMDADANAEIYKKAATLYGPTKEMLDEEMDTHKIWRTAKMALETAPNGQKGKMREAERIAWYTHRSIKQQVNAAHKTQDRYLEYYDGSFASTKSTDATGKWIGCDLHYIYRFYVFQVPHDSAYTSSTWKPVGLLNPHAYIDYKKSAASGKSFLDFVDRSQPAPTIPRAFCVYGCGGCNYCYAPDENTFCNGDCYDDECNDCNELQ